MVCAAAAGLVYGLLAGLAGVSWPTTMGAVTAIGVVQAIVLLRGLGSFSPLLDFVMAVLAAAALLVAAGHTIARRSRSPWTEATWVAVALTVAAVHVKLLLLLHPGITAGDTGFHANRLALVAGGTWLFTSVGPGGDFPYPSGLYVTTLPLRTLTRSIPVRCCGRSSRWSTESRV